MSDSRSTDLGDILNSLGVEVHKVHGDEVNCRCPVHAKVKGRESERFTFYLNSESGLWHCFTCGQRGNLSMLVSELTDDLGALWSVQSHLITNGLRRLTEEEAVYDDHDPNIDWMVYAEHPFLPKRILDYRMLDEEVAKRYGIRWDTELKATLTPIASPLGELRGWQQKKTGWVNNYPEGVHKMDTLAGVERAHAPAALLLESPLDVVRFHSVYDGLDISAVSSMGANVSHSQITLLSLRFDKLIIAMDNDKAGKAETRRMSKLLPSFRDGLRFWNYTSDDPKDIGEMTDGQIIKGLGRISSVNV